MDWIGYLILYPYETTQDKENPFFFLSNYNAIKAQGDFEFFHLRFCSIDCYSWLVVSQPELLSSARNEACDCSRNSFIVQQILFAFQNWFFPVMLHYFPSLIFFPARNMSGKREIIPFVLLDCWRLLFLFYISFDWKDISCLC